MNKEQINKLEKETANLFNKYSFKVPRRILPNILFNWMTPMDCFKTRMRTLLSEISMNKNFEVTEEGKILVEGRGSPVLLIDDKDQTLSHQIIKRLLKQGIDLKKIAR